MRFYFIFLLCTEKKKRIINKRLPTEIKRISRRNWAGKHFYPTLNVRPRLEEQRTNTRYIRKNIYDLGRYQRSRNDWIPNVRPHSYLQHNETKTNWKSKTTGSNWINANNVCVTIRSSRQIVFWSFDLSPCYSMHTLHFRSKWNIWVHVFSSEDICVM